MKKIRGTNDEMAKDNDRIMAANLHLRGWEAPAIAIAMGTDLDEVSELLEEAEERGNL